MNRVDEWITMLKPKFVELFETFDPAIHSALAYRLDDKVSGLSHGSFPLPDGLTRGHPFILDTLLPTLASRLQGFDPKETKVELELV